LLNVLSLSGNSLLKKLCKWVVEHLPSKLKPWDQTLASPKKKKKKSCQVQEAHACNPGYSGDRDHEDSSSKPAWANSSRDPILKDPSQKQGWWSGSSEGSEFKPQYCKKKKKRSCANLQWTMCVKAAFPSVIAHTSVICCLNDFFVQFLWQELVPSPQKK
jgi:hypothetical protein